METTYFMYDSRFEHITLQNCVLQYQQTQNDFLLHAILYKLKGVMTYTIYKCTNYPDKLELTALCEDTVLNALRTYNPSLGLFSTYYKVCLNNAITNLVKSAKYDNSNLSLDFEYENEESESSLVNTIVDETNELVDAETQILLQSLKLKLTENEYKVCEAILADNHMLTQTDISKAVGLTVPAIKLIFKRLQKRFATHRVFAKNF